MTDRDAILNRRARFVAAALASVGVVGAEGCAKTESAPVSPPVTTTYVPEAGAGEGDEDAAGPMVTVVTEDAGVSGDAVPPPSVCLSPPPPPPPTVCLSPPLPPPQVCLSMVAPQPNPQPKTKPRICLDFNPPGNINDP